MNTVVITGANVGIGFAAAKFLAGFPDWHVVLACRSEGKANAAIQAVLAASLGCKPGQVRLLAGTSSRQKRFLIGGIGPEELQERLAAMLPKAEH